MPPIMRLKLEDEGSSGIQSSMSSSNSSYDSDSTGPPPLSAYTDVILSQAVIQVHQVMMRWSLRLKGEEEV